MNAAERHSKPTVFRFRIATLLWITLVISAFFAGRHWSGNAALVQLERAGQAVLDRLWKDNQRNNQAGDPADGD
ncbi:hypothetical protein [Aeoliella sp.]|uniref:hypothetical protein n=1 Tax=Aeoliella sp. TaxID=2795800 RepID=UPI003CCBD010